MDERNPNRLLRRLDWRFLLANPNPEKTICFSDGILQQGLEHISPSLESTDNFKAGQCDLAVALNPTQAVLRSAFDALQIGGEIYTEWYSPLVGGAKGVRHRLERIGFTNVVCYWAWPPPILASSLYWLPLDSSGTLSYFFRNRPSSSSILVRMARLVLQTIIVFGLHTRLLMPVCAIARKPTFDKQDDFQTQINTAYINSRHMKESNDQTPLKSTWMLWTPGHRLVNKIVVFAISDMKETPMLVIKIPRSHHSTQALTSEVHNLNELLNRGNPFINTVPSVLFTLNWNGYTIAGESFIAGAPIYTLLNQASYPELTKKVTDWLIALAGSPKPSPRFNQWDRLVGPVIRDFSNSFRLVFNAQELNCIGDILSRLKDLPIIFEQRDCSPWNILMNEAGEIKVLDWESSEPSGFPALDLIYFLTYLTFFIERSIESKEYVKTYRNAFNPQTPIGSINQACLEKYCTAINLDPSALKPLRLLTWLIHSRAEYQRLKEDNVGVPPLSSLQTSLFATLVREEIHSCLEINR